MAHCFVGLPLDERGRAVKTYLCKANGDRAREVLWGDWLNVDGEEPDGRLRIIWGPESEKPETFYIPKAHTTDHRPLEIVYRPVASLHPRPAQCAHPLEEAGRADRRVDPRVRVHEPDPR